MARYIQTCWLGGEGPFEIVFPDEGTPDEDYIAPGQEVYAVGWIDLDLDDPCCPFGRGATYREVD